MERLMQPDQLRTRILLWAEEEMRFNHLLPKSGSILKAVRYRGELACADAANIVGTGERQARRVVSALLEHGVLTSQSARACALPSPRHSPRAGCLVCSQKGPGHNFRRRYYSGRQLAWSAYEEPQRFGHQLLFQSLPRQRASDPSVP